MTCICWPSCAVSHVDAASATSTPVASCAAAAAAVLPSRLVRYLPVLPVAMWACTKSR